MTFAFDRIRLAVVSSMALALSVTISAASITDASSPQGALAGTQKLLTGLNSPVFVTNAGDSRLFIVDRTGKIVIAKQVSGKWRVTRTFLDITGRVESAGPEQGLLGLAFDPNYRQSGLFYVYYVNHDGNEVVSEFHRATRAAADRSSGRILMVISDPYENHNAGWIAFRPGQPYLYIAEGDGGDAGDPQNRAQNIESPLGKLMRILPRDPDGAGPKRYGIPNGNPFVGKPGRDEIYAYGLRNPWRDSFDPLTGDLWIGDVGQGEYEEIDHVQYGKGQNFGWNLVEGKHLYPSGALCQTHCYTLPVIEYQHSDPDVANCAVTGGYVSRRQGAPLYGEYIFGDYCSGRIWHVPANFHGSTLPAPLMSGLQISSFGVGHDGRLYVLDLHGSKSSLYAVVGS